MPEEKGKEPLPTMTTDRARLRDEAERRAIDRGMRGLLRNDTAYFAMRDAFGIDALRVHYPTTPFVAICGADVPNQSTSTVFANVTCLSCLEVIKNTGVPECECKRGRPEVSVDQSGNAAWVHDAQCGRPSTPAAIGDEERAELRTEQKKKPLLLNAAPAKDRLEIIRAPEWVQGTYGGDSHGFAVVSNDRWETCLGPDETLWTVVGFLQGQTPGYLRTDDEHRRFYETLGAPPPARDADPELVDAELPVAAFLDWQGLEGRVREELKERWRELRNESDFGHGDDVGILGEQIAAYQRLGLLSEKEAKGWTERIEECPGHFPGEDLTSCAYCGDLPPQPL